MINIVNKLISSSLILLITSIIYFFNFYYIFYKIWNQHIILEKIYKNILSYSKLFSFIF